MNDLPKACVILGAGASHDVHGEGSKTIAVALIVINYTTNFITYEPDTTTWQSLASIAFITYGLAEESTGKKSNQ